MRKTFFFLLFSYCFNFQGTNNNRNVCPRYLNNTPFISFLMNRNCFCQIRWTIAAVASTFRPENIDFCRCVFSPAFSQKAANVSRAKFLRLYFSRMSDMCWSNPYLLISLRRVCEDCVGSRGEKSGERHLFPLDVAAKFKFFVS
jgi:hypothetical protein